MAGSKAQGEHKLFSKKRFITTFKPFYVNKKVAALSILLFAVVGVTATYVTNAAQIASEETVLLSNGQQMRLGQSIHTLQATLGDKLLKLNDKQYVYRQKANDPIEVVFDLDDSLKVVIIHLTNKPGNLIAATNSKVGVSFFEIQYYFRNSYRLPPAVASLRNNGIVINQSRSSQYLTADKCGNNTQLASLVSLVAKGYEARYLRDLGGRDCIDKH